MHNKKHCTVNNTQNPDFMAAIRAAGFYPPNEIIPDGKLHRFSTSGKRGDDAGWYVFFNDNIPAGMFGDWRSGFSQKWHADIGRKLSKAEDNALRERVIAQVSKRMAEEAERHEKARWRAKKIWNEAVPVIHHPYLKNKKIKPHGAKVFNGALVIPIHNEWDRIVNIQFIQPDGTKRFLAGGQKKGCFLGIGELTNLILICEGFATGASIYEASIREKTPAYVVVAFDAGNLLPVAKNIKKRYPHKQIIICGDNDKSGIGQDKAREASLAINCNMKIPPIEGMDWNDYLTVSAQ